MLPAARKMIVRESGVGADEHVVFQSDSVPHLHAALDSDAVSDAHVVLDECLVADIAASADRGAGQDVGVGPDAGSRAYRGALDDGRLVFEIASVSQREPPRRAPAARPPRRLSRILQLGIAGQREDFASCLLGHGKRCGRRGARSSCRRPAGDPARGSVCQSRYRTARERREPDRAPDFGSRRDEPRRLRRNPADIQRWPASAAE